MVGTWWFPFFSALSTGALPGTMMLLDLWCVGVRCHQGTQTGLDHPDTRNEITGWWFEGQNGRGAAGLGPAAPHEVGSHAPDVVHRHPVRDVHRDVPEKRERPDCHGDGTLAGTRGRAVCCQSQEDAGNGEH